MNKPPIGIMPEYIWKLERIQDLKEAIYRYLDADCIPDKEWYDEYEKLIREMRNN
jgi:hypothetical protein